MGSEMCIRDRYSHSLPSFLLKESTLTASTVSWRSLFYSTVALAERKCFLGPNWWCICSFKLCPLVAVLHEGRLKHGFSTGGSLPLEVDMINVLQYFENMDKVGEIAEWGVEGGRVAPSRRGGIGR